MENMIHTLDASNVDRYGFFCYKSKPKNAGFHQKRTWLDGSLAEGLRLIIIYEGNRSAASHPPHMGFLAWFTMLSYSPTAPSVG
jgi:hypothetical protein